MYKNCTHNQAPEKTYARMFFWYIKNTSTYTGKQMSDVVACAICGQEIQRPIEYYPCMYIGFMLLSIATCAGIEIIYNIISSPIIAVIFF